MNKILGILVIMLASSSVFAVNQCKPPKQLVFKWEYRDVWTCDTRIETYTYDRTRCDYRGTLYLTGNYEGSPNYTTYALTSRYFEGNVACPNQISHTTSELYTYTDSDGYTYTDWADYSGLVFNSGRLVETLTGEREVTENCRYENKRVKVSYCEDLR